MKEGKCFQAAKGLASQLAQWDSRITQVATIKEPTSQAPNVELICSFDPEPDGDTIGFFWIANLLTRLEFEGLDEHHHLYDLGFRIGEEIFLPNGVIIRGTANYLVVWPEDEQ